MAEPFREPERRQKALLPADMMDWLPQDDIVQLIVEAVAMTDLSKFEAGYKLGGAGKAPVLCWCVRGSVPGGGGTSDFAMRPEVVIGSAGLRWSCEASSANPTRTR